jgi:hypothetical protein
MALFGSGRYYVESLIIHSLAFYILFKEKYIEKKGSILKTDIIAGIT